MTRREFVELLSGTVAAWPFVAHAQQGAPRHIGVLGADAIVWNSWTVAFVARLRELGWIEGDTIDIDYRWAGGSSKRVSDFTAELLRRHVEVIVTYGSAVAVLDNDHSHRLGRGIRSGRRWPGYKFGAAGRQRYWYLNPTAPAYWQAA